MIDAPGFIEAFFPEVLPQTARAVLPFRRSFGAGLSSHPAVLQAEWLLHPECFASAAVPEWFCVAGVRQSADAHELFVMWRSEIHMLGQRRFWFRDAFFTVRDSLVTVASVRHRLFDAMHAWALA